MSINVILTPEDMMGSDLQPEYKPERKVNPVQRRLADVSKAKQLLNFESQVSLEEGLSRLVTWWHKQKLTKETRYV